ncbi:uncharacterized protein N7459_004218 [Penicillium hispanicum]|uniref:uncharacterized protein n=1 Tax=Penicillium hispanicum TaxID=1080232 RepID=UPI00253FE45E|nr:uncharacterized protein N7459_004218 [Penicillium hispanicum]KAJ5584418.1 hypothetical protein N7459_004218 [Penicillium hispanicum]
MMAETKPAPAVPRKRGRPRTITDDQQVPEVGLPIKCFGSRAHRVQRRRKQLRVAQQAYRKRKETTINNLQTRVQELEVGIEQLSESFLSFSNLLLEANLLNAHPEIANSLQEITQQCVSLAKHGCDETSETATSTRRKSSPTEDVHLDFDSEIARSDDSSSPIENSLQLPTTSLTPWPQTSLPPTPPYQEQATLPFGIILSSPTMQFANAPFSPPIDLDVISSQSLTQEGRWTLSHRLVRECCQNGYRLLVNTPYNSTKILEIFGCPLTLTERNRLISGFYYALRDDAADVVEVKSRVLTPLHSKMNVFTPGQCDRSVKSWQFVINSGPESWLDASEVQRLVQEQGLRIQDTDSPRSNVSFGSPQFNIAAFTRRE